MYQESESSGNILKAVITGLTGIASVYFSFFIMMPVWSDAANTLITIANLLGWSPSQQGNFAVVAGNLDYILAGCFVAIMIGAVLFLFASAARVEPDPY